MNISVNKIKTIEEKKLAFEIRKLVFVVEQMVDPQEEYDPEDQISVHFIAFVEKIACGTCRWRFKSQNIIKLERFAVLKEFRNTGVGMELLKTCLNDLPYAEQVILHAQIQVIGFYEKIGFKKVGEEFLEANIRHYKMVYKPN